jgi:hypothetical protein
VQEEKPSATAWRVALARAAHQLFDKPTVVDDPLALRIVGAYAHGNSPESLFHNLRSPGFREVRDPGSDEMNARYLSGRTDSLKVGPVGRVLIASV